LMTVADPWTIFSFLANPEKCNKMQSIITRIVNIQS
jgi:hypothetical protein